MEAEMKADYYLHKAVCYLQLQKFAEALECLGEGLRIYPEDRNLLKERS